MPSWPTDRDAVAARRKANRDLIAHAMATPEYDGVDRAQIQRMIRLSPAERLTHMLEVVNQLAPLRGLAKRH
jgi:hypothetical protein